MASPCSFAQLFSSHPPTLSSPPTTLSPSLPSASPWPPPVLPLFGSSVIRVQDSAPPSHMAFLNSLVGYFSPPRSDLPAIEKWAQTSWNDPNIGCCSLQHGGILSSFPSREGSEMASRSPPLAFKGATLSISRWNPSVGAFLPHRIWLQAFNKPLHACNLRTYKAIGEAVGGFICIQWKSSEFLPFGTSGLAWPGSRLRRLPNSIARPPILRHAPETLVSFLWMVGLWFAVERGTGEVVPAFLAASVLLSGETLASMWLLSLSVAVCLAPKPYCCSAVVAANLFP
ncbi:hypothetical protein AMTRI_Chr02g262080 [Amborella trichopoda]